MSDQQQPDQPAEIGVTPDEVVAELDDIGRAKWQAAVAQAITKKTVAQLRAAHARIAELEQQNSPAPGPADE